MTLLSAGSLTILDVGHGSAAVVRVGDQVALIDAGPGNAASLEYLVQQELKQITNVILSHADQDHVAGLLNILTQPDMQVAAIYLNADSSKGPAFAALTYEIDLQHAAGAIPMFEVGLVRRQQLELLPGVIADVMSPGKLESATGVKGLLHSGERPTSNSLSVVVRLLVDGHPSVLLPGDLDAQGLNRLVAAGIGNDLKSDVLVFPHHGGRSSTRSTDDEDEAFAFALAQLVQPKHVLISLGRGAHGTPQPAIVAGIRKGWPTALLGCTQLSDRCAQRTPTAGSSHLLDDFSVGRDRGRCCAGTMKISLSTGGVLPAVGIGQHLSFITTQAPTALCQASIL